MNLSVDEKFSGGDEGFCSFLSGDESSAYFFNGDEITGYFTDRDDFLPIFQAGRGSNEGVYDKYRYLCICQFTISMTDLG